jgi:hypothetical protein
MRGIALIVALAVAGMPSAFAQKGPQPGSGLANPSTGKPYTVHPAKKKNKGKSGNTRPHNSNPATQRRGSV